MSSARRLGAWLGPGRGADPAERGLHRPVTGRGRTCILFSRLFIKSAGPVKGLGGCLGAGEQVLRRAAASVRLSQTMEAKGRKAEACITEVCEMFSQDGEGEAPAKPSGRYRSSIRA